MLSRSIKQYHRDGQWKGISIPKTHIHVTHSLFVDDMILFGLAANSEATDIKATLDTYMKYSNQKINSKNSKIYVFNSDQNLTKSIIDILGFHQEKLPSQYLGIPFFTGASFLSHWDKVIQIIPKIISSWKGRWLSLSGIILMIKTVLSKIPNYFMAILKAPRTIISIIEKSIRSFLWKGNMDGKKKIPFISIKDICSNKLSGGAGVHDLTSRTFSLGAKLVGYMYSKPSLNWYKILKEKYLDNDIPYRIFTI